MKVGGQILWNCYTYLRNVTDLWSDGKTPYERRFGQPFKGPIVPIGSIGWVSPYNCEGQVKSPSIWKESLTWIVPRITLCMRGEFGRVTYWLQTLRSWRRWTHRKSTRKDSKRKRWYFPNKENSFFQSQMDESKPLEETRTWEHPPWHGRDQFKERVNIDFLGESEGSLPQPQDSFPDVGEAINDFWSMSGSFIYRHHVEPRVKLFSPERRIIPYST